MDWTRTIDSYCERVGAGLWAEPVNAATNLAFLLAALFMARRLRGADLPLARALTLLLALIGVGSLLFHMAAQVWAALLDVVPIGVFTLLYLYAAHRGFFGWGRVVSVLAALAFIPFAVAVSPVFQPLIGGSATYAALPLAIFGYAAILMRRALRWGSRRAARFFLRRSRRGLWMRLCATLGRLAHISCGTSPTR